MVSINIRRRVHIEGLVYRLGQVNILSTSCSRKCINIAKHRSSTVEIVLVYIQPEDEE